MQDFKELKVWQKADQLTLQVYRATSTFPVVVRYGLTSQLRRAASSIPANLAEGCDRKTAKDLMRFVHVSAGSASECQYHLLLASDLQMLSADDLALLDAAVIEIRRMLQGFEYAVTRRIDPNTSHS